MSEFRLDWIAEHLPHKPTVILDVGAYDASDAIRLKQAYPCAKVFAFEASPDAHAKIVADGAAKANGVEVVHAAVSNRDGSLEFHPNTDARNDNIGCSGSILEPTPHNLAKYPFLQFKEPVKVAAMRLDSFCALKGIDHIDVVHMDVQGAEGYAIEGLGKLRPSMLFFEIDATDEYKGAVPLVELFARLSEWGYEKKWQGAHDALFVLRKSSALDNLTVCVTSWKRAPYLDRALESCRAAGIRRITIATSEPDEAVEEVIRKHSAGWLSFDVRRLTEDVGCGSLWVIATYSSRTNRVLVLHDDDLLRPEFGRSYENTIAPALDAGAGFASWRPNIVYDDGSTAPCDYRRSPTGVVDSSELGAIIAPCLTHSPVVSVLDRETVIHACKEAEQTLVENDSLQRQGMLLGTELVVYLRHVQKFKKWMFVDEVLSSFGSHAGSGTIAAFNQGATATQALRTGYELAKKQATLPAPAYLPRLILVYSQYEPRNQEEARRIGLSEDSWKFHFNNADVIELPVGVEDVTRTGADVGDKPLPFVRDLFDIGCRYAMPEDVVVYINRDIGLTTMAPERLLAGIKRGQGVTVCPRRMLYPRRYRLYKTVTNCKHDGGFDAMAVTPKWWHDNRDNMPDMLIAREGWDTVFRTLAEEWADNRPMLPHVSSTRVEWSASRAYMDDVCWHEPHEATWSLERTTNPGQKYNRRMARAFFSDRKNIGLVALIDKGVNEARPVWPRPVITEPVPREKETRKPEPALKRSLVVSPPVAYIGAMEILICPRLDEMEALRSCLKSIDKYGSGFSGVTIAVPPLQRDSFGWVKRARVVTEGDILIADEMCPSAAAILHMEATGMMWRPCCPNDFAPNAKPILVRERYADIRDQGVRQSQKGSEAALGFKPEYDCTVRQPLVFLRETYAKARSLLKLNPMQPLNAIGHVAIAHHRDRYTCVDYDWESDCKELGVAFNTAGRYIYRRERDKIVPQSGKTDTEAWLNGKVPAYTIK